MKDQIVIPAAALFFLILIYLSTHKDKKPTYSVTVVHDYYIIESFMVNDLKDTIHYPDSYLIIHKIN